MNSQTHSKALINKLKKLPDTPGVYFFLGRNKKILYIGKATSLRDRVRSYFGKDLITTRGQLLVNMMLEAKSIDHQPTDSVLEALILEADLIRKFKPEFNTKEKDDKSFYCVVITDEDFPVIKLVRKKDLEAVSYQLKASFGPYPESRSIKEALKIIRRIFPYRDEKCPGVLAKRPCFNYMIGKCPGVCAGVITKKEYSRTIRNISLFFQGKKKKLLASLNTEMKSAAKAEEFELARTIRNQIFALEHIRDVSLIKYESPLKANSSNLEPSLRLEAYDIAHMSGTDMVGVMVVMQDGEFVRAEYRKFIIRNYTSSNDTGALTETLSRRLNHPEWRLPDILVVDGGDAQKNAADKIISEKGLAEKIKVLSVVKDDRHKARAIIGDTDVVDKYNTDIIKLNAECHRYAITFHRQRRAKRFLL